MSSIFAARFHTFAHNPHVCSQICELFTNKIALIEHESVENVLFLLSRTCFFCLLLMQTKTETLFLREIANFFRRQSQMSGTVFAWIDQIVDTTPPPNLLSGLLTNKSLDFPNGYRKKIGPPRSSVGWHDSQNALLPCASGAPERNVPCVILIKIDT